MNLKSLMEDRQLDFNQPLLSVRRVSSTAVPSQADNRRKTDNSLPKIPPLPAYKSELKSGPVRNPGSVPFRWEQTPGRPKGDSKSKTLALEQPPIAPKLPPGRALNVKQQALDKGSKGTTVTQSQPENVLSSSPKVSSLEKNVTKHESSKEKTEEEEGSSSDDGDEAYLDALDTISRTESFFMNCSVSGLSGLDGPDVKPSGTFSTDPQTRDFMMDRFLPAAKQMASETPQHAIWKQPVAREKPRQVEKVVSRDMRGPLNNRYRPNVVPHYAQDRGEEESEDDDDDDCDGSEKFSAKFCGVFPRFCLKNSFCLLNPVPGMRMQPQVPIHSVRRVRAKSSYAAGSCSEIVKHARDAVHEQRQMDGHQTAELHEDKVKLKSESNQTTYKSDCDKLDESSLHRCLQGKNSRLNGFEAHKKAPNNFRELLANEGTKWESGSASPVIEKTLYIDSVHIVKSPNSNSNSSFMEGLTDYKEGHFLSLVKSRKMENTPSVDSLFQDITQSSVVDEKVMLQLKRSESVDSCFLSCSDESNHDIQMETMSGSKQDLCLHDFIPLTTSNVADIKKIDLESQQPMKSGDEESPHGLIQDSITLTSSKVAGNGKIDFESQQPKQSGNRESSDGLAKDSVTLASTKVAGSERIDLESQRRMKLGYQESSHGLIKDFVTLMSSKVAENGKIDLQSKQLMRLGNTESSHGNFPQLPLALPLPKSPSESWLKRTLPTVSSRNLPSRSSLTMRIHPAGNQASKTTSVDPKWETIVKTSNVHHGHSRFSEELLAPIPEG